MRTAPYPVLHDTAHRRVRDTTFVVRRRHFKGQNEDFLSLNITLGTSRDLTLDSQRTCLVLKEKALLSARSYL